MSEAKYDKKVTVREIVDFFKFEQLTGDDHSLDRWTVVPDINRPGFELCGFMKKTDPRELLSLAIKNQNLSGP
jgi:HPr kinase/phosphorylase